MLPIAAPVPAVADTAASSVSPCVALVLDRTPGSYGTNCVPWSSGITGLGVLRQAGHAIQFRQDGLVCQIDGYPGGACQADATHYWSYWHRAPGASGWTYSSLGPASYQPPIGGTEGWAYLDGATRQPANVAFATICPPPRTTPPRTTAPPRPPPARTSTRAASTAPPPAGGPARPSAAGTAGRTATAQGSTRTAPAGTTRASPPGTSPAAGTAGSGPPTTTPASAVMAPASSHPSGGSPAGVVAGLVLAGGIAGAALWYARTRRGSG